MSAPQYMPLYVEKYLADAEHLPTIGHGAYFLLIMNYWRRQKPLPADDFVLAGIAKLSEDEWLRLKPHIAKFFQESDGLWHHKRIDEEIQRASDKIEQARSKGLASAQQRLNRSSAAVQPQPNKGSAIKGKDKDISIPSVSNETEGREKQKPNSAEPPDARVYRRGREVLGSSGGGIVKKLIDAHAGNLGLASASIETASTKADPKSYLMGIVQSRQRESANEHLRNTGDAW